MCIVVVSFIIDETSEYNEFTQKEHNISLVLYPIDEVCLVNDIIYDWYNSSDFSIETVESLFSEYIQYGRFDYPVPVTIRFSLHNIPENIQVEKKYVKISENSDFQNSLIVNIENHKNEVSVYNLKVNTTYFYQVIVELSEEQRVQDMGTFNTKPSPRYCFV